jgi:hypothetical protein
MMVLSTDCEYHGAYRALASMAGAGNRSRFSTVDGRPSPPRLPAHGHGAHTIVIKLGDGHGHGHGGHHGRRG